ncbi:hypothetical protein HG15A2_35500 [Adhaeretor mobilis]|uniref:Uncharacterized protein n=1 Tax=Adhaeretor mobilis TaxID=1930276 RepID=A0A517MZC4_9BACT|nr:hypothetical protein HG15A2_35500 [Adhaeretor mobilis]
MEGKFLAIPGLPFELEGMDSGLKRRCPERPVWVTHVRFNPLTHKTFPCVSEGKQWRTEAKLPLRRQ